MAIKAKKIQPAKTAAIEEAKKTFADYSDFIFADYRGLTVEQITALRDKLREKKSFLLEVKSNISVIVSKSSIVPSRTIKPFLIHDSIFFLVLFENLLNFYQFQ
mgnify:CR=1 FL=1